DFQAVDWDHAIDRAVQIIKGSSGKAVAIVSPRASTEALFLARQALRDFNLTAAFRVERVGEEVPLAGVPNLALRSERAPNVAGATLLGYREDPDGAVKAATGAALVLVLDDTLA